MTTTKQHVLPRWSLVSVLALATSCDGGCGADKPGPPPNGGATASASAAPKAAPFELALLEHFPRRVAFSPGGHQLATLGHHEMVVWDAESGAPVHVFSGSAQELSWSPDGKRIAVADAGTIRLYELADESMTTPLVAGDPPKRVTGLGWVGKSELVAFLDSGELVRMLDEKPAARTRVLSRAVSRVSFDPARERVAVAPSEPTLPLELVAGADFARREALAWDGRDSTVLFLSFSSDGSLLAGLDNRVTNGLRVWDTTTRKSLAQPQAPAGRVNAFAWSPDGRFLALAGNDSGIHVVEARTGKSLRSRPLPGWNGEGVDWSPDGRSLAVAWRALTLHDAETLEPAAHLWVAPEDATHLACAENADALIAVGRGGDLVEWNLARGEVHVHPGLASDAFRVSWTASDSRWIVVAKHEVRVIDAKRAEVVAKLALELPATEQDLPSPDGKWLAQLRAREVIRSDGGTFADAGEVLPSDLPPPPRESGKPGSIGLLGTASVHPHLILRSIPDGTLRDLGVVAASGTLAISADAERVAVITDRGIEIFDVQQGRAIKRITTPPHGLGPMGSHTDPFGALSPDGSEVVAAAPGFSALEVWRASDGSRARKLPGFGGAPLVWAADGKSLATAGVWRSASDGRVIAELHGELHQAPCFGPKGRWLAVASRSDLQVLRRDGRSVHLRRIPVRLEWSPFVWQSDGGFDGGDEAIRRVWLVQRGGKPRPASDLSKLRHRGLLSELVRDGR